MAAVPTTTDEPSFPPIAIIGRGCVLPGASSPDELWSRVLAGEDLLSAAPEGMWRIPHASVLCSPSAPSVDRTWSTRGGYVQGFAERFDPTGFAVPADQLVTLDPLVHWVLHSAREALRSAGITPAAGLRAGAVFGNLSYPTSGLTQYAESVWTGKPPAGEAPPDPRNRFMSGLPAHLLAQALELSAGAFALDAACASSLYALKLACDALHDGRADLMLAGGVNHADDLFIHVGFCALGALSRTGQSRPFHRDADGLMPAEGAAFVALRRLPDAIAAGDRILGVIRGIGLSNDGRGSGLLAPSEVGQAKAMRAAYQQSGLAPSDISLVECHATGTPVGDAVELRSMREVFGATAGESLAIGSLKSNLGHLTTAAGVAGLLKVLSALEHKVLPPTRHTEAPLAELTDSPFRLIGQPEPWSVTKPRRAAISAFGFGGNNAHLIVEEFIPDSAPTASASSAGAVTQTSPEPLAIVGLAAQVGSGQGLADFARALFSGQVLVGSSPDGSPGAAAQQVRLALNGLRFPPQDLGKSQPQQLMMMRAVQDAVQDAGALPVDRTSVLVGMQCDAEIARYTLRLRLSGRAGELDAACGPLDAAGVVGAMPNIVANRINSALDLMGPSFTVSAEELSGIVALRLGARALRAGEVDACIVGAVDLSCEPVHGAAAAALLPPEHRIPGDAAVAVVIKRLSDAQRDGNTIYALLPVELPVSDPGLWLGDIRGAVPLSAQFGHAHAASGLLQVVAAALACQARALPGGPQRPAIPWLRDDGLRTAQVTVQALGGAGETLWVTEAPAQPPRIVSVDPSPRLRVYAGKDRDAVRTALLDGKESAAGEVRVALLTAGEDFAPQRDYAVRLLAGETDGSARAQQATGVYFRDRAIGGQLAFVFTMAASAYPHMGRDLLLSLPQLSDGAQKRFPALRRMAERIYNPPPANNDAVDLMAQLESYSFLCQIHVELSRQVLGLTPQAAIGLCTGESSSLFAMGVWRDMAEMFAEIGDTGLYTQELGGEFAAVRRAWKKAGHDVDVAWASWRILLPVPSVLEAAQAEPLAYVTLIHSPTDCVISGHPAACDRVLQRLGPEAGRRSRKIDGAMAIHCPEVAEFGDQWLAIHRRQTSAVPGVRFYTHATCDSYVPDSDSAAQAILGQAMRTVDFPRLIDRAWQDGVRVFVEHGPRALCTDWIGQILGSREHLAVSLDAVGRPGLLPVLQAAAQLFVAGVPINHQALNGRPATGSAVPAESARELLFPAHRPAVRSSVPSTVVATRPTPSLPEVDDSLPQLMVPAPFLPAPNLRALAAAAVATAEEIAEPELISPSTPESFSEVTPEVVVAPADSYASASPVIPDVVIDDPVAWAMMQTAQGMLDQHGQFLRAQAALHDEFLAARQRALQVLLAVRSGGRPVLTQAPQPVLPMAPLPQLAAAPVRAETIPAAATAAPVVHEALAPAAVQVSAVSTAPTTPVPTSVVRPGPKFSRADLEVLASGEISAIFGPEFRGQDGFTRQVRMPMPPLLLADRVTGIDAVPHSMGKGTLWTETDVAPGAWYLHDGHMPAGIMVESGQADLLLISWLGVDRFNKSERVYRLLGCELQFHGGLPAPGDTLCYEIQVEGHAVQSGVRLFFFRYDCYVNGQHRMTMRRGQAGFFTDEELAGSAGVLWDAKTAVPCANPRLDPPVARCLGNQFSEEQVNAFARGDAFACFGPGFERALSHVRTPHIADGQLRFWRTVTDLDFTGGPWGRGYLRAEQQIRPDDWFFPGHFKNDPCMPGTLMCEACLQAMAFFMTALGYTLDRDGWRFEPVADETFHLRCRGQVSPTSQLVVYEVFVEEIIDGPTPTLYADILCTVDGLKAFHGRRMGYRLVRDWPISSQRELLNAVPAPADKPPIFDYASLLACAWGRPSDAFGAPFLPYDAHPRIPRLPGPPYHFMSRVSELSGECGVLQIGATVTAEYEVPADAWYFLQDGAQVMPFAVLLEVALQPCGWLAMFLGCKLLDEAQLFFRNLDGQGTLEGEVTPHSGTVTTRAKLIQVSRSPGIIIVGFAVECYLGERRIYHLKTVFGFFPPESLAAQVGLPLSDNERQQLTAPSDFAVDLTTRPARYCEGPLRLASPMLLMLDRVTGYWPTGGKAGLGRLRAEKDVNAGEWFFKAHFYQDPVQPGSLGVQAMIQLIEFALLHHGAGQELVNPRFSAPVLGVAHSWKYRGQVTPRSRRITVEIEILELVATGPEPLARAEAWLYVDGLRIYHAKELVVRVVSDPTPPPREDRNDQDRNHELTKGAAQDFWMSHLGVPLWPGAELLLALVDRFVGNITVAEPEAFPILRKRGVLILANHQVQVESLLLPILLANALGRPVVTLADARHEARWLGQLARLIFSYPGVKNPDTIRYFNQEDRASLLQLVEGFRQDLKAGRRSVMVHVEGKLGLQAQKPVEQMSSLFLDLALNADVPILPVRFARGLPVAPLETTRDFPVGYGRQDYHLGRVLWPEELRALPYAERKRRVLAAINATGPALRSEAAAAPDPEFERSVVQWQERSGSTEASAVLLQTLLHATEQRTAETQLIAAGVAQNELQIPNGPAAEWTAQLATWLFGPGGPRIKTAA